MPVTDWSSFVPDLAATLIGAALGIPTGLWLNGKANRAAEALRAAAERERAAALLVSVTGILRANSVRLKQLGANASANQLTAFPDLDSAAWAAVAPDIAAGFADPQLRGRLASHFQQLDGLLDLNRRALAVAGLGVESTLPHAASLRAFTLTALAAKADELAVEAGNLADATDVSRQRLLGGAPRATP